MGSISSVTDGVDGSSENVLGTSRHGSKARISITIPHAVGTDDQVSVITENDQDEYARPFTLLGVDTAFPISSHTSKCSQQLGRDVAGLLRSGSTKPGSRRLPR